MKRLIFLLLFITAILTTNSCKKPVEPLPLDKDFLSYFAFPKGSWWVYKDAKSGLRDSFYVAKYQKGITQDKEMGSYEGLSYDLESKYIKSYGQAIPKSKIHFTYQTNGTDGYAYRFSTPNYVQFINETYKFSMKHLDSFQVNNIWYKDVYQTESLDSFGNATRNEFYAKNIGVIKRIHYGGIEMDLVKYHHNN